MTIRHAKAKKFSSGNYISGTMKKGILLSYKEFVCIQMSKQNQKFY